MATIVAQPKSNTAPFVTFAAAAETGDKVLHAPKLKLLVMNGGSVSTIVTVTSEANSSEASGTGPLNWTETVPAGQMAILDLSNPNFKKTSDGLVSWGYSVFADVKVAAITL